MENDNLDYRPEGIGVMMLLVLIIGICLGICSGVILSSVLW